MNSIKLHSTCLLLVVLATLLFLSGCATKVTRMDEAEVKDLSGAWNDTDSQMVSEEMINDMLQRSWVGDHRAATGQPPAVIVGEVRNLSHEHINVNTFVADIERAMVNSGRIDFVASSFERQEIRDERKDQDLNAREESRNAMGQELGADFMLKGQINTIIDHADKDQVRYYQVDLTLISLENNRKVWLGQKKIKKFVERSKLRY